MQQAIRWVLAGVISLSSTALMAQTLMDRSLEDLAGMVKAREVTAETLVTAAIDAARANEGLNALITIDEDGALDDAMALDAAIVGGVDVGPLAGVPIVVKDNINAAGILTTAGTPGLNVVPKESAPALAALEAAGAIVIGKANMHELAFGITSDNAAFGPVRNPYDNELFAGGSSGGTAAAIAAGIVPAGLGTDTGGSVRIPAALTGVVGFRPSTWRQSQEGVVPISHTRDVVGPMARTVADVVLLNQVMGGGRILGPAGLDGVRLGVAKPQTEGLSPEVATAFDAALERLTAAGAVLVDVDMRDIVKRTEAVGFPIALYEAKGDLAAYLAAYQPDTTIEALAERIESPDVKAIFETAVLNPEAVPEAAYQEAIAAIDGIRNDYVGLLNEADVDALIFPTTVMEAQPIATSSQTVRLNGHDVPTFPTFIRNTDPASIYGAPGLSLPMGLTPDGVPVGLELDGRPDGDIDLLTIGLAVERALSRRR